MASLPGAGALRERVLIEARTATRDAIGGQIETWSSLATLWGKIEPMSTSEQFRRSQMQSAANWKITIRYRDDITPQMRVRWLGHTFLVRGIQPDDRRRFLELACDELSAVPTDAAPTTCDVTTITCDDTIHRLDVAL